MSAEPSVHLHRAASLLSQAVDALTTAHGELQERKVPLEELAAISAAAKAAGLSLELAAVGERRFASLPPRAAVDLAKEALGTALAAEIRRSRQAIEREASEVPDGRPAERCAHPLLGRLCCLSRGHLGPHQSDRLAHFDALVAAARGGSR